jgi:hypothetical protein
MFAFPSCHKIHLRPAGIKSSSVLAPHAKKQNLGYVSKVEANAVTVWASVLTDLVSHDIALVLKTPRLHHFQALREKLVEMVTGDWGVS